MLDLKTKNKILDVIKDNKEGISSIGISKKLDINRITLSKYLSVIESESLVYHKEFGMAKVWYFHKIPPVLEYFNGSNGHNIKSVLDTLGTGIIVVDHNNNIVWVNKSIKEISEQEMVGNNFSNMFNEINKCSYDPNFSCSLNKKCSTDKNYVCKCSTATLEFINNKEKKLTTTISPILNSEENLVGYIHLIKTNQ